MIRYDVCAQQQANTQQQTDTHTDTQTDTQTETQYTAHNGIHTPHTYSAAPHTHIPDRGIYSLHHIPHTHHKNKRIHHSCIMIHHTYGIWITSARTKPIALIKVFKPRCFQSSDLRRVKKCVIPRRICICTSVKNGEIQSYIYFSTLTFLQSEYFMTHRMI